jgi:hypothetical protein
MDILLRVEFLKELDSNGVKSAINNTPYTDFYDRRFPTKSTKKFVENFVSLYKSIKRHGFDKSYSVLVVRYENCHNVVLPPDYETVSYKSDSNYELADGAHRTAILTHLGERTVPCFIYSSNDDDAPDYSTYIEANSDILERYELKTELSSLKI